jgi:uncharacterized protein YciI
MGYFLVALKDGPAEAEEPHHADAHVAFIDSLIERKLVFLGGDFSEPIDGVGAAYLLRCESLEKAREIAADDPYAVHGVCELEIVEWRLVGIDPMLIDPELTV